MRDFLGNWFFVIVIMLVVVAGTCVFVLLGTVLWHAVISVYLYVVTFNGVVKCIFAFLAITALIGLLITLKEWNTEP